MIKVSLQCLYWTFLLEIASCVPNQLQYPFFPSCKHFKINKCWALNKNYNYWGNHHITSNFSWQKSRWVLWEPKTECAWKSPLTFETTATALCFMPLHPDELKIHTKQLLLFACHLNNTSKWSELFTLPSRQWWIFQLLALSFSCVPALSALCWALTKAQHSSHRFKLCSPQILSTSSALHPLFFSFQCLSLQYCCSSASFACVLSCLAPPHPSPSPHPELATCLLSLSPLCGFSKCMSRKARRHSFFFFFDGREGVRKEWEGGRVQLCILISWAVAPAVWGRLVLAVCCVIQRCSCLFLITYLIVPVDAAGVLVEENKTWTQSFQSRG